MVATTTKKAPVAKKASAHPPFLQMIQEAVLAHPEDARTGVSRPTIKKFLATKYKLDLSSASNTNNLANAIKRGAETGVLVLPKGVSGKIKLAPKAKAAATKKPAAGKENAPPAKKAPVKKAAATTKKATTTAKKPAATKAATAKKPAAAATKKAPAKKTASKKADAPAKAKAPAKKPATKKKVATAAKK